MTPPVRPEPVDLDSVIAARRQALQGSGPTAPPPAAPSDATHVDLDAAIEARRKHLAKPEFTPGQQFGTEVAQGATLNFAPKILGGLDAINAVMPGKDVSLPVLGKTHLGGEGLPTSQFGDRYAATRDRIMRADTEAQQEHPVSSFLTQLLSGAGTALPVAAGAAIKAGASGASPLARVAGAALTGAKTGAVAGGVAGIGHATGGAKDYATQGIEGAAGGALLGTALGGGLAAAGSAARGGASKALDVIGRPEETRAAFSLGPIAGPMIEGTNDRGTGAVFQKAQRSGLNLNTLAQDADASGKPMNLMDVGGKPLQRLGRGVRSASPDGDQIIESALGQRAAGSADRAIDDALETTGLQVRTSAHQTAQDLIAKRTAEGDQAYGKAFATPTPIDDPRIQKILQTPAGKRAWPIAEAMLANDGHPVPTAASAPPAPPGVKPDDWQRMLQRSDNAGIELPLGPSRQTPTLQQLHYLKLALDDAKQPGLDRGAGAGGIGYNQGRSIHGVQKQLLTVMDEVSPDYAAARSQFADNSSLLKANDLGKALFSTAPEDAAKSYADLGSAAEREVFRRAGMDALAQRLENGSQDVEKGVAKPRDQRRLRLLFPDDQSFSAFRDRLSQEGKMLATQRTVLGGSNTADKLADLSDMAGVPVQALVDVAKGNPLKAATRLAGQAVPQRLQANTGAIGKQAASLLTAGSDGDAAARQAAIQKLRDYQSKIAGKAPGVLPGVASGTGSGVAVRRPAHAMSSALLRALMQTP